MFSPWKSLLNTSYVAKGQLDDKFSEPNVICAMAHKLVEYPSSQVYYNWFTEIKPNVIELHIVKSTKADGNMFNLTPGNGSHVGTTLNRAIFPMVC